MSSSTGNNVYRETAPSEFVPSWDDFGLILITNRTYARIAPDRLPMAGLVEVQVGFSAVRLGHQEYAFLPKLRAICLLERQVELVSAELSSAICLTGITFQDYNARMIRTLMAKSASPLNKVKRKVGYDTEEVGVGERRANHGASNIREAPVGQMKRLCLEEKRIDNSDSMDV